MTSVGQVDACFRTDEWKFHANLDAVWMPIAGEACDGEEEADDEGEEEADAEEKVE